MTGFLKNVGLMFLSGSLLISNVFAGTTAVQENETEAKIEGITEKGKNVIVNVLAPDKTYENLFTANEQEYGNILIYHNQGKADADGIYVFTVDMSGKPSGLYGVYATDSEEKGNLIYTDMTKNADAIRWLQGLTQAPVQEDFDTYQADLGFYNDLYESVNKSEVISLIYKAVEDGKLNFSSVVTDFEKRNAVIDIFNKATVISGVNTQNVSDIMNYSDYIGLKTSKVSGYLNRSFVDKTNFRKELTSRMSNRSFDTEEKFDETFVDEFILSAVKYPDGYSNLTEMLNDFADDIGITKNVTATIASEISGKSYSTTDDLAQAINGNSSGSVSGGSGSGGGGGGFSSGKGASSNKVPNVEIGGNLIENTTPSEYHVDIFTDLEGSEWAREAIVYLAELDIINGDGNFKFNPKNNVTREEFTKMVVQAFAPNANEAEIAFKDVAAKDWFAPYIKKAKGLGIINGKSETEFGVGENITRQDMAVIVYNAAKIYGVSLNSEITNLFEDDDFVAEYAKSAVYALRNGGIVNGKENNSFCPLEYATRAEAAKIIYGLLEM